MLGQGWLGPAEGAGGCADAAGFGDGADNKEAVWVRRVRACSNTEDISQLMSEQRELGLPSVYRWSQTGWCSWFRNDEEWKMRRIGLLGGMSWHSSIEYYTRINEAVAGQLGGHHSARILLDSTDFADIREMQIAEDWAGTNESLVATAQRLVDGGAEAVAIATNLMHKCAPAIEAAVDVPLIHIVDSIATVAKSQGYSTLAVLGTKWTMLDDFYTGRLECRHSHAGSR